MGLALKSPVVLLLLLLVILSATFMLFAQAWGTRGRNWHLD